VAILAYLEQGGLALEKTARWPSLLTNYSRGNTAFNTISL